MRERALAVGILVGMLAGIPYASASAPRAHFLVILDAGHGGADTGAIGRLGACQTRGTGDCRAIAEKDITLALARKTARALSARGIASLLTRESDSVVPLDRRVELANRAARGAREAVFVSIHLNSDRDAPPGQQRKSSGLETYVFNATTNEAAQRLAEIENGSHRVSPKGVLELILSDLSATANYEDSVSLACRAHAELLAGLNSTPGPPMRSTAGPPPPASSARLRDRGVRPGLFYVLMGARVPSILIEAGFASNPAELARLVDPAHQERFAAHLAKGLARWRDSRRARSLRAGRLARHSAPASRLSAIRKPNHSTSPGATTLCR